MFVSKLLKDISSCPAFTVLHSAVLMLIYQPGKSPFAKTYQSLLFRDGPVSVTTLSP